MCYKRKRKAYVAPPDLITIDVSQVQEAVNAFIDTLIPGKVMCKAEEPVTPRWLVTLSYNISNLDSVESGVLDRIEEACTRAHETDWTWFGDDNVIVSTSVEAYDPDEALEFLQVPVEEVLCSNMLEFVLTRMCCEANGP